MTLKGDFLITCSSICHIYDQFKNCILIGDKDYRSHPWRLTLFEYADIELSVPYRSNELIQYTMPDDYARIRKRLEVIFSQLVDQMNIRKNHAKSQAGYFARFISNGHIVLSSSIHQLPNKSLS